MSKHPIVKLGQYVFAVRGKIGSINGNNLPVYGVTNIDGITITGKEPSKDLSKYLRLRPKHFAYNPYRINVGSIGLADENQDGIVSLAYVVFATKPELDSGYLFKYLKSQEGHNQINFYGNRGSVRQSLRFDDLCKIEIPLPPLSEQRRIVARIEELTTKIEEAKGMRSEAIEEAEAVIDSALENIIEDGKRKWGFVSLDNICDINPSKKGISCDDDFLVSFVPMAAVDDKTGRITKCFVKPYREVKKGYKWFIEGDVIFARITPCMENGKIAIAKNLKNRVGFGSTEFHVLRPKEAVLSEWIHYFIRRINFRNLAERSFKGTAGQQRVQEAFFYKQEILLPPKKEQRRIVAHLDSLWAKIDNLKELQLETQSELDALIPSVLAKAFRGEL